jgi:hypothetical protein
LNKMDSRGNKLNLLQDILGINSQMDSEMNILPNDVTLNSRKMRCQVTTLFKVGGLCILNFPNFFGEGNGKKNELMN